jgi:hypothetical protein
VNASCRSIVLFAYFGIKIKKKKKSGNMKNSWDPVVSCTCFHF